MCRKKEGSLSVSLEKKTKTFLIPWSEEKKKTRESKQARKEGGLKAPWFIVLK